MPLDNLLNEDKNRVNSWLKAARDEKKYFNKMIFYWIAFNVYYGKRYINPKTGKKDVNAGEPAKVKSVLSHLKREEFGEKKAELFLKNNKKQIDKIINNMSLEYYGNKIKRYQKYIREEKYKSAFIELILLIEKVRNRLFHGSKTYMMENSGNKEVLVNCCFILDKTMVVLGFK